MMASTRMRLLKNGRGILSIYDYLIGAALTNIVKSRENAGGQRNQLKSKAHPPVVRWLRGAVQKQVPEAFSASMQQQVQGAFASSLFPELSWQRCLRFRMCRVEMWLPVRRAARGLFGRQQAGI